MNDNKQDNKKDVKLTEAEAKELLKEVTKKQLLQKRFRLLNFMLHPNYVYHILLSMALNLLLAAAIYGFSTLFKEPLMTFSPLGFILAFFIFTYLENFLKLLLYRYFFKAMYLSVGLISFLVLILIFVFLEIVFQSRFHFNGLEHLFIFAISFSIFRVILANYIRSKFHFRQKMIIRR